jgi:hypothetical protein
MHEQMLRQQMVLVARVVVLAMAVVVAMTLRTGAAGAAVGNPDVPSGAVSPAGSSFYVDCQAPSGGNGSLAHPWDTLTQASDAALAPGQRLLFKRGTHCRGTLEIQSSGAPGRPVVVGAYGTGALPRVAGTSNDTVLIENASYVTVQDLNVTNRGSSDTQRRGVHVVADDVTVKGILVQDLFIHGVTGDLSKDTGGSGGIQLDALGTSPYGRFDGVLIRDNRIDNVSRSGIFIVGTQEGPRPPATESWPAGSTGVVVRDNSLDHLAGDGIVATGTVGAVLERNVVSDGNRAGTPFTSANAICDAGIWTWDANDTLIQDNEVSHMEFNGCDGTGYDVDYNQDGTVVQDNLSFDNAGGFILLCTDSEPHHAVVRYNLSIDDASTLNVAPCDIAANNIGTLTGIHMYNNTFVAPKPQATLELHPFTSSLFAPGKFVFANNIVDATTHQSSALPCGSRCSNNLFYRLPPSGTHAIVGKPRFKNPTGLGTSRVTIADGFKLDRDSPAYRAGKRISGDARRDFFGDPIPRHAPPTVGFYQ